MRRVLLSQTTHGAGGSLLRSGRSDAEMSGGAALTGGSHCVWWQAQVLLGLPCFQLCVTAALALTQEQRTRAVSVVSAKRFAERPSAGVIGVKSRGRDKTHTGVSRCACSHQQRLDCTHVISNPQCQQALPFGAAGLLAALQTAAEGPSGSRSSVIAFAAALTA